MKSYLVYGFDRIERQVEIGGVVSTIQGAIARCLMMINQAIIDPEDHESLDMTEAEIISEVDQRGYSSVYGDNEAEMIIMELTPDSPVTPAAENIYKQLMAYGATMFTSGAPTITSDEIREWEKATNDNFPSDEHPEGFPLYMVGYLADQLATLYNLEHAPKGVPLIPGLADPECCKIMEKSLEQRNHADYQCYMRLEELLSNGSLDHLDKDDLAEIKEILQDRIESNDRFAKAITGRK